MAAKFDVTALPMNMRTKIMVSVDQKMANGSVCWEWTGAVNGRGYGSRGDGFGKTQLTHRAAYEILVDKIPAGLTIDHLCFNTRCVNTGHMEVVTREESSRRKILRQTHCKQGHALDGDNLRIVPRKTGHTRRVCVTCQRDRNKAWMRASRKVAA